MNEARLKLIAKILVSTGLLVFVFYNAGIEETLAALSSANLWYVPVAVGALILAQTISTLRWKTLAEALGFKLAYREFFDYYLIGMYLNLFLPSAIGGDMGKMVYLARATGKKKREALLTLIAERGFGLIALMLLASAICLTPVAAILPRFVPLGLISITLGILLGIFMLRLLPLARLVEWFPRLRLLRTAEPYWRNVPLMIRSTTVSLLFHLMAVGIHMLIAQALGISISPLYLVIVYGVVSLASMAPTFNGLGSRELAYQYMLAKAGVPDETGATFGLYWLLVTVLTSMIGGLVLVKGHYKTPTQEEMDEDGS